MWDRSHVLVRRLDPCQNYVNHKIRQTSKAPGMCRTRVSQSNHGAYPSVDGERLNILSSPIQQYHSDPCFLTCTFEITSPPCRDMHMVVAKQAFDFADKTRLIPAEFCQIRPELAGGYVFPSNPRYKTVWTRRKNVFPETHCIPGKPLMPSAYNLSRSKAIVDKIPENATASWPFRCATVCPWNMASGRQSLGFANLRSCFMIRGRWLWWQSNGTSWNIVLRRPSKLDSS